MCSRIASMSCSPMRYGGSTHAESPEWMPASSMCCMTPPITTRVPSEIASTSHLERVLEEAIDEHRAVLGHAHRACRSSRAATARRRRSPSRARRARRTAARAPDSRCASATSTRLVDARRRAVGRLREPELARDLLEAPPVLGDVDRVGRRAEDRHAGRLERARELERRLAAELHDHAHRLLALRRSPARPRASAARSTACREVSKSVETVSGFELIMIVSYPCSRSAIAARTQQ